MYEYLEHLMWGIEDFLDVRRVEEQWQLRVMW
jgi:hypothetical protein